MTGREASLVERLIEAGSPRDSYDWEERDGYYLAACRVSQEDIPGLLDLVRKWGDQSWPGDAELPPVEHADLLPITAWRALADMKAAAAVQPIVDMLRQFDDEFDDEFDDWMCEELPHVFGKIGEPAIEPLIRLATHEDYGDFIRSIAVTGLRLVVQYWPDTRQRIVACLTEMMANARDGDAEFNSTLLINLVELEAVEAAEPIERAFAANRIDLGMMGNWEDVRQELGVQGLGLEMPADPYNSMRRAGPPAREGIGIFSDCFILMHGDIDHDAEQAYYERAAEAFSSSIEAQQVIQRHGDLQWFPLLLEFGLHYLAETVDGMTPESVEEFLFDFMPRKVSTEADSAASIVDELTLFWEFLDRAYPLPSARSIVEWLKSDGLVARLQAALSDPSNFGMAKSIFMQGQQAGYDMTSEDDVARFVMAYNQSLPAHQPPPAPIVREQRVGRNAPCPCGSGKKFKKCCGG